MKNRIIYVSLFILLFSGCALQELMKDPKKVEEVGEVVDVIGTGIIAVNPQIGLVILVCGGLFVAVSKLLGSNKVSKKKR